MIKKAKTPEQLAVHEAEKKAKRNHKSAITKAQNIMMETIKKRGLRTAKLQLEYILNDSKVTLPNITIGVPTWRQEIIDAYTATISEYLESLSNLC